MHSKRDCEWCIPTGFIAPMSVDDTSICYPTPAGAGMLNTRKKERNKDNVEYIQQLSLFSSRGQDEVHKFLVGFHSIASATPQQCPEVKAVTDLMLTTPDIPPVWNCADVASNLADAMEGIITILWDLGPGNSSPWEESFWAIDVQQSFEMKTS